MWRTGEKKSEEAGLNNRSDQYIHRFKVVKAAITCAMIERNQLSGMRLKKRNNV